MGHYASEMACSTCGRIPCGCVRMADMTPFKWLVDASTLEVMQVAEFDRKYEYIWANDGMVFPGNPLMRRMDAKLFDAPEEAMAHRIVVVDSQIKRQQGVVHEANVRLQELLMKKELLG